MPLVSSGAQIAERMPKSTIERFETAFERTLYRRLYRASELDQVLLTIGLAFVSVACAAYVYGTVQQPVQMPSYLRGSFSVFGLNIGVYRLFLVGTALAITLLLVVALEYTRFGAQVRASVDNQRMARGLGINVDAAFAITFALGSGLAGLGVAGLISGAGLVERRLGGLEALALANRRLGLGDRIRGGLAAQIGRRRLLAGLSGARRRVDHGVEAGLRPVGPGRARARLRRPEPCGQQRDACQQAEAMQRGPGGVSSGDHSVLPTARAPCVPALR